MDSGRLLLAFLAFGAAVATVGCRAGMATGLGPEAVGVSATKAVVGGIVAAIVMANLVRQLGRKAAFELVALGQPIGAGEALRLGMRAGEVGRGARRRRRTVIHGGSREEGRH